MNEPGDHPRRQVALRHRALHRPVAVASGSTAPSDTYATPRARLTSDRSCCRAVERAGREQVHLAGEREVAAAATRPPHAAPVIAPAEEGADGRSSSSRRPRRRSPDRCVLQHAALQVPQAPRHFAVVVVARLGSARIAPVVARRGRRSRPSGSRATRLRCTGAIDAADCGFSTRTCAVLCRAVTRARRLLAT